MLLEGITRDNDREGGREVFSKIIASRANQLKKT